MQRQLIVVVVEVDVDVQPHNSTQQQQQQAAAQATSIQGTATVPHFRAAQWGKSLEKGTSIYWSDLLDVCSLAEGVLIMARSLKSTLLDLCNIMM